MVLLEIRLSLTNKEIESPAKPFTRDRVRPSLEAFGFDIGAISSELLHNELKWSRDGQFPEYFTLVSALFCAESGDTGTFTLTAQNPIP